MKRLERASWLSSIAKQLRAGDVIVEASPVAKEILHGKSTSPAARAAPRAAVQVGTEAPTPG